ncbi:MAG: hypothetical protein IAF94_12605 [Pirellulaceae bacterium]|nr:hypothetical protein [Pirellulaceae bacterium]
MKTRADAEYAALISATLASETVDMADPTTNETLLLLGRTKADFRADLVKAKEIHREVEGLHLLRGMAADPEIIRMAALLLVRQPTPPSSPVLPSSLAAFIK